MARYPMTLDDLTLMMAGVDLASAQSVYYQHVAKYSQSVEDRSQAIR